MTPPPRLLVIDGNAPWVRSLFAELPGPARVDRVRVYSAADYARRPDRPPLWGRRRVDRRTAEWTVLVPGWTRCFAASSAVLAAYCRWDFSAHGRPAAVVLTMPYYAELPRVAPGVPWIYLAHDVFRYYAWNTAQTERLERKLLGRAGVTLAVARSLMDDFRHWTRATVDYLPTAVTTSFVARLAGPGEPCPADLAGLPRPVVGCTGQINTSYDWPLIESLAAAVPEATFAFIGPVFADPELAAGAYPAVAARPNVRFLGPKPHHELPAYLRHFDVCLNPLKVSASSDRRSPLRLFDYLATDRPILSTAIREAHEHLPYVEIGRDAGECARLLKHMVSSDYFTDLTGRAAYIRRNTWKQRAELLMSWVEKLNPS